MPYQPPTHTESSILQTFILPPIPLPTILPYPSFLKVVPAKYVNDPTYSRVLKRLYRDLQLQRDLDVETVRANIERECARAPTLQAGLARQIAREEGRSHSHSNGKNLAASKKRKRPANDSDEQHEGDDESETLDSAIGMNANEDDHNDEHQDVQAMDTDDDLKHESTVQHAFSKHPLNAHPASNLTYAPSSTRSPSRKLYIKSALLDAMQIANDSLIKQNEDLERKCREKLTELEETVGGLSDLRYGSFSGKGGGSGGDKVGELAGAMRALRGMLDGRMDGGSRTE